MTNLTDNSWKPGKSSISIYLFLCAAGILIAGLLGLPGNKISIVRLTMFFFALIASLGLGILGWQVISQTRVSAFWSARVIGKIPFFHSIVAGFTFLTCWTIIWTPLEKFGDLYYYALGIYPFIVWASFASGGALILITSTQFGIDLGRTKTLIYKQRLAFMVSAGCLIIFGLLAWLAATRIFNIKPTDEDFWYGTGAPVLIFQVLAAIIAGFLLSFLINKWGRFAKFRDRRIDLAIFIFIWALSAWLWAATPVRPDFLITKPVAPNVELYPDYDARNYDIMSQFALIGQGINNHIFFDRVLYSAFLTYLHTLFGQDYALLMAVQAAIFSIIPAILYLIGKHLYSRTAGLGLGFLIALRGINQIDVGNIIETAHQKHMLTEYPTAVLLVIVTLLLIKWTQEPRKNWHYAGLAGGIISLSTLLRPHPIALLPLIFALSILIYKQQARLWIGLSALVLSCAFLSIFPWLQFGGQNVSIVSLYMTRINSIIEERYPQLLPPTPSSLPLQPTIEPAQASEPLPQTVPAAPKSVLSFATDHFLNNLVTSVLILPTTPFNLEARVVVKKTENIWKSYWDGILSPWGQLLLTLNLLFIALGIGASWMKSRISGVLPLLIMLTYFTVNALGRTSGGRYLVPVDWIVIIYYVIGLVTAIKIIFSLFSQPEQPEILEPVAQQTTKHWLYAIRIMIFSVFLGSLIPLSQIINPIRFQVRSQTELISLLSAKAENDSALSRQNIQTFLTSKDAVILEGRSLYTRQFNKDEGLDISIYPFYHSFPYPRTYFTVIGPAGENAILLPRTDPAKIPNTADVVVIGCKADGYIQAWGVINLDNGNAYTSLPLSTIPSSCPLSEPVCDNNKNCR